MDSLIDRKSVHILFCDQNPSTFPDTLALLHKCSYRVTAVKSARDVVEALKMNSADVDIVLTDVELPQEKGFKVLKHITRQENLHHIAIVVMSDQDEMPIVAKCLLLGAVDYLVKPLRLNEVMNLWAHMWRRRRLLELPDKQVVFEIFNPPKPNTTTDFLSSYKDKEGAMPAFNGEATKPRDGDAPQLELSLRLSTSFEAGKPMEEATVHPHNSYVQERVGKGSAFTVYSKWSNQQPDEHSGNMFSPSISQTKRVRIVNVECSGEKTGFAGEAPAVVDVSSESSKDVSMADENRPGDTESQICEPYQSHVQCTNLDDTSYHAQQVPDEMVYHVSQLPPSQVHAYHLHCGFMDSPPTDVRQGARKVPSMAGYTNPVHYSSQATLQHSPPFHCKNSVQSVQYVYSYYPLPHLAVPVVGSSTWPAMAPSPPPVGVKMTQAQLREAALSKFRMKRKGRCFEKKIRYASRKKLAEQRPRVRGQFVKRATLTGGMQSSAHPRECDEEGEADDEQGCSELDNNSSPEFMQEDCRVG